MSRIQELISKYCPNGVEYKSIKDIAYVTIGEFVHKNKQTENGAYPVYNGGTSNTGFYDEYNHNANNIIISARGANAGFVNKVLVNYWAGNSCYSIDIIDRKNINWLYVYYALKSNQHKFIEQQQCGGIPAVSKKQVETFLIPVPPLPVQEEIVKILDSFTELEAELEARKKQYEHYRDKLLSPEHMKSEVQWKTLRDIATIKRGVRVVKKDLNVSGIFPVYQNSLKPLGYHDKTNYEGNTTFVITAGAAGDIGFSVSPFWAADDCLCIKTSEQINNKYVYQFMMTQQVFLYSRVRNGAVPRLSREVVENLKIPVPSLAEQERIVSILDRFDTLVNDISEGLPAEIKARRGQYEYYRDKLLTFEPIAA